MKSRNGFSLLELLAATVILGVLITVVLAPVGQLFQNTNRSGQTLRVVTQAQEVTEYIRGQWQSYPVALVPDPADASLQLDQNTDERTVSQSRYDRTCFSLPTITNMTSTVTVKALNRSGSETGTLSYATCPSPLTAVASPASVPMKRVTVTLTSTDGKRSSTLTTDIPSPIFRP